MKKYFCLILLYISILILFYQQLTFGDDICLYLYHDRIILNFEINRFENNIHKLKIDNIGYNSSLFNQLGYDSWGHNYKIYRFKEISYYGEQYYNNVFIVSPGLDGIFNADYAFYNNLLNVEKDDIIYTFSCGKQNNNCLKVFYDHYPPYYEARDIQAYYQFLKIDLSLMIKDCNSTQNKNVPPGKPTPFCNLLIMNNPLNILAFEGNDSIIKQIKLNKDKINNNLNTYQLSPLALAVLNNQPQMVGILIDSGADINEVDLNNMTPFQIAVMMDYLEIAKYLLAHGANKEITNIECKSALDIANDMKNYKLIELLTK